MKKIKYILVLPFICFYASVKAQSYTRTLFGIKASAKGTNIEIQFFTPRIVRVLKSPSGTTVVKSSLCVVQSPQKQKLNIHADESDITISSNAVQVKLNKLSGQITFTDVKGRQLLDEQSEGVKFIPFKDSIENTYTVMQAFQLKPSDAIYGLGQHQAGHMNQRNQKVVLKNENMQIGIPFIQSSNGYGLFWDNYSTTVFDDNASGTSFSSQVGNCADYYFIYGGNADKVIAGFRYLTGQAPMFPRWVFGYWQSRERYKSQQEAVGVVKKYRELKVPFDGLVQDWQYWGVDEEQWNSTEFGNPNYPNPQAMVDSVHQLNAHIIISVWPSFGNKTKIWADMKDKGFLYSNSFVTWPPKPVVQVYDAFNPKARDLWWSYANKNIFSLGMDGWWLDSTEPDHVNPKESDDNTPTFLGTFRKVRNAYPLLHTEGVYRHQRQTSLDKRVFILARSAFAGQQRNATTVWSGDIQSDWSVLRNQISGGLNLSLSGIPYWNTDIGGFFANGHYHKGIDEAFKELYVRWLQFGTFCPMMRSHGTDLPREIYQFGKKGTWAYDAIEKYINLRYRLLPYNYSNSWGITANASTMMRALVMDFPEDKKVLDINNEYMFGKAFLVCPVTDSMYTSKVSSKTNFDNIKSQRVYLPANHTWIDFWTGDWIKGGQFVEKETPIDMLPLYVKAGSIVPMGPFQQYTNEKSLKDIELRIYPGADGTFTIYEDENDNYNYEKHIYSTIELKWNDKTKALTIDSRKGSYPGMLKSRTFNVIVVKSNHGVGTGITKPDKAVVYNGIKKVVTF